MHILFLSDNFPPEANAPASRTFEHCREWVKAGHQVTVITATLAHRCRRGASTPSHTSQQGWVMVFVRLRCISRCPKKSMPEAKNVEQAPFG